MMTDIAHTLRRGPRAGILRATVNNSDLLRHRTTANHDQVDADTKDGHRSHDPELTQRQSLPERMKSPVELMQPAQRSLAGS
jgi:hypothetical protein